ncbi:MAG: alkyl hydroperoxide reductase/Thiol specific antioxidant/Mal allergen [Rhodospirillales bacterium]|nr:alkyl hydroperoxide reductase/Thiol specific antioxidant/Mal allergen [Rhodospirillales bacterium]
MRNDAGARHGVRYATTRNEANARAAGVAAVGDDLVELYKGFGNDLPLINGDPSWTLPMPARFVIGRDGTIEYAEVNADYTRRPDPSELFPTLDRLQNKAAA